MDVNVNFNNEKVRDLLLQLNSDLEVCMNEEKFVSVHLCTKKMQIRFCISPEEADFSVNGVYMVRDMFQINISHIIDRIEYLGEKSYCVIIDNVEIYIDFVDSNCCF